MRKNYLNTPNGKLRKKSWDKTWSVSNKEQINNYNRYKYKNDIQHKLKVTIRNRLNTYLRNHGITKYKSSTYSIGCSYAELKLHLESQFKKGMTWDNHQLVGGWHVDHIKELCQFDLTDTKQLDMAQHYTNLQPLWAGENLSKRSFHKNEKSKQVR
jgi:hypothetical protein